MRPSEAVPGDGGTLNRSDSVAQIISVPSLQSGDHSQHISRIVRIGPADGILQVQGGVKGRFCCRKAHYRKTEVTDIHQYVHLLVDVVLRGVQPKCILQVADPFRTGSG